MTTQKADSSFRILLQPTIETLRRIGARATTESVAAELGESVAMVESVLGGLQSLGLVAGFPYGVWEIPETAPPSQEETGGKGFLDGLGLDDRTDAHEVPPEDIDKDADVGNRNEGRGVEMEAPRGDGDNERAPGSLPEADDADSTVDTRNSPTEEDATGPDAEVGDIESHEHHDEGEVGDIDGGEADDEDEYPHPTEGVSDDGEDHEEENYETEDHDGEDHEEEDHDGEDHEEEGVSLSDGLAGAPWMSASLDKAESMVVYTEPPLVERIQAALRVYDRRNLAADPDYHQSEDERRLGADVARFMGAEGRAAYDPGMRLLVAQMWFDRSEPSAEEVAAARNAIIALGPTITRIWGLTRRAWLYFGVPGDVLDDADIHNDLPLALQSETGEAEDYYEDSDEVYKGEVVAEGAEKSIAAVEHDLPHEDDDAIEDFDLPDLDSIEIDPIDTPDSEDAEDDDAIESESVDYGFGDETAGTDGGQESESVDYGFGDETEEDTEETGDDGSERWGWFNKKQKDQPNP